MIEQLPKYVLKWLKKNALKFPNVIGYSNLWQPREVGGKIIRPYHPNVVRFYVIKKVSLSELEPSETIPALLRLRHWFKKYTFITDVVVKKMPEKFIDKTKNFRPVELGVSVGNEKITAGSLGMLYEGTGKLGYNPAGSNAHVVTDGDSSKTPEEIIHKNILQRGSYHGGKVPDDVVGQYIWHKRINPINDVSKCKTSNLVIWILNGISGLFGRQTRFKTFANMTNTIDFGIYKPTVPHILKIADNSINIRNPFIGHLFAGSDTDGIICKISEILKEAKDYIKSPLNFNYCDVKNGDRVKGCSFWCNYETVVTDANATIQVNYGSFIALFTNIIMVKNDGTIRGGWSGSGWFKVN